MKCPLRLRGISILGIGPRSNPGAAAEAQGLLLFHLHPSTDCEVIGGHIFFFYFQMLPGLDVDLHVG